MIQSSDDSPELGSIQRPFKLAIIGGGPCGCSIIVRAIRLGLIQELCGETLDESDDIDLLQLKSQFKVGGVCLIDTNSIERFGGGRLQDYAINSNTFAERFYTNVVSDKEALPVEAATGTTLEKLKQSSTGMELANTYGMKTAPLRLIGRFLNDVGSVVLETLAQFPETSLSLLQTKASRVQRYEQEFTLDPEGEDKNQSQYPPKPAKSRRVEGWKILTSSIPSSSSTSSSSPPSMREIHAKNVLIATGGVQSLPRLSSATHSAKLISSDDVCTVQGVGEVRRRILACTGAGGGGGGGPLRVVVVGGSHSAFSAIWILLNKLDEEPSGGGEGGGGKGNTTAQPPVTPSLSPSHPPSSHPLLIPRFETSSICLLHRSAIKVFYNSRREAEADRYSDYSQQHINKSSGQVHAFAGIRGDAKALWRSVRDGKESRVRLMPIKSGVGVVGEGGGGPVPSIVNKLFDEAAVIIWACGYSTPLLPVLGPDPLPSLSLSPSLVPIRFTRGQVDVDSQARVLMMIDPSKGLGWGGVPGTGLNSSQNKPPRTASRRDRGSSEDGSPTTLYPSSYPPNLVPVPVPGLFGCGLGFGLRQAADGSDSECSVLNPPATLSSSLSLSTSSSSSSSSSFASSTPLTPAFFQADRADGVAVYLKRGASLVLSSVLGPEKVYGKGVFSWEMRNQVLKGKGKKAWLKETFEGLAVSSGEGEGEGEEEGEETVGVEEGKGKGKEKDQEKKEEEVRVEKESEKETEREKEDQGNTRESEEKKGLTIERMSENSSVQRGDGEGVREEENQSQKKREEKKENDDGKEKRTVKEENGKEKEKEKGKSDRGTKKTTHPSPSPSTSSYSKPSSKPPPSPSHKPPPSPSHKPPPSPSHKPPPSPSHKSSPPSTTPSPSSSSSSPSYRKSSSVPSSPSQQKKSTSSSPSSSPSPSLSSSSPPNHQRRTPTSSQPKNSKHTPTPSNTSTPPNPTPSNPTPHNPTPHNPNPPLHLRTKSLPPKPSTLPSSLTSSLPSSVSSSLPSSLPSSLSSSLPSSLPSSPSHSSSTSVSTSSSSSSLSSPSLPLSPLLSLPLAPDLNPPPPLSPHHSPFSCEYDSHIQEINRHNNNNNNHPQHTPPSHSHSLFFPFPSLSPSLSASSFLTTSTSSSLSLSPSLFNPSFDSSLVKKMTLHPHPKPPSISSTPSLSPSLPFSSHLSPPLPLTHFPPLISPFFSSSSFSSHSTSLSSSPRINHKCDGEQKAGREEKGGGSRGNDHNVLHVQYQREQKEREREVGEAGLGLGVGGVRVIRSLRQQKKQQPIQSLTDLNSQLPSESTLSSLRSYS